MRRLVAAGLVVATATLGIAGGACRLRTADEGSPEAGVVDSGIGDVNLESAAGQGYLAVQARGCGDCHQSPDPRDGVLSGTTLAVPGTQAYGSNLTPDPETGMDSWDAGSIAQAVLRAVDSQGQPLCPAMPAYADAGMSTTEALAIATYLESLTPVWHPVPTSRCPPLKPSGDGG